jgi:hypothetical protein
LGKKVGATLPFYFFNPFGDERADYAESLKKYYKNGPLIGWDQLYISIYASAHPWEDLAETWANYLHMMDTHENYDYHRSLLSY